MDSDHDSMSSDHYIIWEENERSASHLPVEITTDEFPKDGRNLYMYHVPDAEDRRNYCSINDPDASSRAESAITNVVLDETNSVWNRSIADLDETGNVEQVFTKQITAFADDSDIQTSMSMLLLHNQTQEHGSTTPGYCEEAETTVKCSEFGDTCNYMTHPLDNLIDCEPSVRTLMDDALHSLALPDMVNEHITTKCCPGNSPVELGTFDNVQELTLKVKKKRRREKNPDPPPEAILPPCKICDEKSTGYHYGANTCEACKGFFRRTLKKKEVDYKCKCKPEEQEIWKRGPYRNGCPACRYERCLNVGMSRNAIKIGRYTVDHKTNNIKQVKCLETDERTADKMSTVVTVPSQSDIVQVENIIETALAQAVFDSQSPHTGTSSIEDIDIDVSFECLDFLLRPQTEPTIKKPFTESMPDYLKAGLTLKEIDTIVKIVTEAHTSTRAMDETPMEELKQRHTEHLEKYKLKTHWFGDMNNLTNKEFLDFYKITGLAVDDRLEHLKGALSYLETKISYIVEFGKAIPGFKHLHLDDQTNLIKASRSENALFSWYKQAIRRVDFTKKVVATPWGKDSHFDELGKFVPISLLKLRMQLMKKLMSLELTTAEEALTRAIVITSSDRCQLHDPEKVDFIREKMVYCLQHLLNVRHGGPGTLFYKIVNLITDLRTLSEQAQEVTKTIVNEPILSQTMSNFTLIREIIS